MLALQELVRRGHTIDFYNVVEESRDIPGVEVLTFRNNPVQDFLSRFLPIKIFHPINVLIYEYLEQPSFDQAAREANVMRSNLMTHFFFWVTQLDLRSMVSRLLVGCKELHRPR